MAIIRYQIVCSYINIAEVKVNSLHCHCVRLQYDKYNIVIDG